MTDKRSPATLRRFRLIETREGAEMREYPDGPYVLYSELVPSERGTPELLSGNPEFYSSPQSAEQALLPCPRCGSHAEVVHASHIRCANTYNCDCETRLGPTAWNRRAFPSSAAVTPDVGHVLSARDLWKRFCFTKHAYDDDAQEAFIQIVAPILAALNEARIQSASESPNWACRCGHTNGPNLERCAACGRPVGATI